MMGYAGMTATFLSYLYASPVPEPPEKTLVRTLNAAADFEHSVGLPGSRGWAADYKSAKPGYALSRLKDPLMLPPGVYRMTFNLRRGHYPNKGMFHQTYGLFRLEIWDLTANERLASREIQIGDFSKPNIYAPRWMEFATLERTGHLFEPRVHWLGLGNGEVESVVVERFRDPSLRELEQKARRLGENLQNNHLENGFVVSRKRPTVAGGTLAEADETGDALTYTAFYVASLAWKYSVTKDELTYQALENGLAVLHKAIQGTESHPVMARYVDKDGTVFPKSPSKDVYTSYFLALSAAYPRIENAGLKKQIEEDVRRITLRLVADNLQVKAGGQTILSLTPYVPMEEVKNGVRELLADKKLQKSIRQAFKTSRRVLPFYEVWPGLKDVVKAMDRGDEERLIQLVVPTLNGTILVVERVRDLLREQYRSDLFPRRKFRFHDLPGRQLADLLTDGLKKLPRSKDGIRFERLSDLKVNSGNALLALHVIKTGLVITQEPSLIEYYRTNLYTQDALLKAAMDWYSFDEDFLKMTAGNRVADRDRRGYLSTLALYNLTLLETNPSVRESYEKLLGRQCAVYQYEDNPLMTSICAAQLKDKSNMPLVLKSLDEYPENRSGFGKAYWSDNGKEVATLVGGGENSGYSREPLPASHRPKDSFLWQRNPRRLKGDEGKEYPGTDFLFVYWFCRAHKLIPPTPPEPTVHK